MTPSATWLRPPSWDCAPTASPTPRSWAASWPASACCRPASGRPRMRRWMARIGLGLAVLLVVAAGATWLTLAASLPRYAGTIVMAGLDRPVRVVRDADAIPHVEAATEADAYQAMGYLHGQDRLWQMEFDRLAGQGRLAEVLGEAALPVDRYLRTPGLAPRPEADGATQSPAHPPPPQAHAPGVNAPPARHRIPPPPQVPPPR